MSRQRPVVIAAVSIAVLAILLVFVIGPGGNEVVESETSVASVQKTREPSPSASLVSRPEAALASEAPLDQPIVETPPPARETAPDPTPEPEPEPTPTPAPVPAKAVVRVVEADTHVPLENIRVQLSTSIDESADELPIPGSTGRFDQDTDVEGIAHFDSIPEETYVVTARYGAGPRVEAPYPMSARNDATQNIVIEYPAKTKFLCRLINEAEEPVANRDIETGVSMFPWMGGGGRFAGRGGDAGSNMEWQDVTTDSEGYFSVLAWEGMRNAAVRTDGVELFSSEAGRGWGNPFFDRQRLSAEREIVFILQESVVIATGRLVNAPEPLSESGYFARVRSRQTFLPSLHIEDDRFTFSIPTGSEATIEIGQEVEAYTTRDRFSREVEKSVEFPDEPGPFEFDLEFEERAFLEGIVYMPDGSGAPDVTVFARAFTEEGTAEAHATGTTYGRSGGWGGRRGGQSGEPQRRYLSPPTDGKGRFRIELPPTTEYLFVTDTETLPEDAKGSDPVTLSWTEIQAGTTVELWLKTSSIIWGEVFDSRGYPVPGTRVNLRGPDIPWNSPDFGTTTDQDGVFELNIPPVRLAEPDPEEPPEHYIFAWHQTYGGGLGQVFMDDPDKRVRIALAPFARVRLTVTEDGAPVPEIRFSQLYTVPGFSQPVSSRNSGRQRRESGVYDFRFLLKGVSSVSVWNPDVTGTPRTIFAELDSPDLIELSIDLAEQSAQ